MKTQEYFKSSGFTVIELIVVIAVISVIAAIVVFSVTGFMAKGKDAAIKSNLSTALTDSVVFFSTNSTYTGLCTDTTSGFRRAYDAAAILSGQKRCYVNIAGTAWCACARYLSTTTKYFCVDSVGTKREITGSSNGCSRDCSSSQLDYVCDGA